MILRRILNSVMRAAVAPYVGTVVMVRGLEERKKVQECRGVVMGVYAYGFVVTASNGRSTFMSYVDLFIRRQTVIDGAMRRAVDMELLRLRQMEDLPDVRYELAMAD